MSAQIELPPSLFKCPQDLCFLKEEASSSTDCLLAVADEEAGVVVVDYKQKTLAHAIASAQNALAISYDKKNHRLLVSVAKPPTQDELELQFYDSRTFQLLKTVPLPDNPSVGQEYTRWVACNSETGAILACCGDNKTSALWILKEAEGKWDVLYSGSGDLEHVAVKPCAENGVSYRVQMAEWTYEKDWGILLLDFDVDDKIVDESRMVISRLGMPEPWSSIWDSQGHIHVYEYQTGHILEFTEQTQEDGKRVHNPVKLSAVAYAGQSLSMDEHGGKLATTNSELDNVIIYLLKT